MIASCESGTRTCNRTVPNPEGGRGMTVLVVDDIEPVASILQEVLTQSGQTASYALSGEEALQLFNESEIEAVISDLEMPGMDGWELGRKIKEACTEQGIRKPAFILLTGWGEQAEDEDRMSSNGVDAVMAKPVNINKLLELVRNTVDNESEPDMRQ